MASIDIDCVDGTGSDEYVQILRRMYPHALRVHSVGHMVHSILGALGTGHSIRRLRILGHGSPGSQGLGQSSGGPAATAGYRSISLFSGGLAYSDALAQLTGRFDHWNERADPMRAGTERARGGWVELHGCNVGASYEGMELAQGLSRLWGVNVEAGTGYQSYTPGFEGFYIVAHPDGTIDTKFGRPVYALTT